MWEKDLLTQAQALRNEENSDKEPSPQLAQWLRQQTQRARLIAFLGRHDPIKLMQVCFCCCYCRCCYCCRHRDGRGDGSSCSSDSGARMPPVNRRLSHQFRSSRGSKHVDWSRCLR